MLCEQIKEIIPRYIAHSIEETQITEVEEHLCVCNDCRLFLGQLMDKPSMPFERKKEDTEVTKVNAVAPIPEKNFFRFKFLSLEYIVLAVGAIALILFIFLLIKS